MDGFIRYQRNDAAVSKPSQRCIEIHQVPIEWNEPGNQFTFFGVEGIIFWKDPSLLSLLNPLREEIGPDLYALLVAFEVSKGTYEDYHSMVHGLGDSFEEGFMRWGQAVSGAGWGEFHLEFIDWDSKTARVRVERPWELQLFSAEAPECAAPFLNGKLSGIFSWAFETNCRARVETSPDGVDTPFAVFHLAPSATTLSSELAQLHDKRGLSPEAMLKVSNRHLKEQVQRFFNVLESEGAFVWEVDRHLQLTFASDQLGLVLGLGRDSTKFIGSKLTNWVAEEDRIQLHRAFADLEEASEKAGVLECRLQTVDQAIIWVSLSFHPTHDLKGAINGYRGAGRDITQRRRDREMMARHRDALEVQVMERTQALDRAQLRNRMLLDSMADGLIEVDPEGFVRFLNPAACRMFNAPEATIIGRNLSILVSESRGALHKKLLTVRKLLSLVHNQGRLVDHEAIFRRFDDSEFPVVMSLAPTPSVTGEPEGVVISFKDMTDRLQIEERLRQAATVYQSAAEAIIVTDANGTITDVNPAFESITGYTREEAIGNTPGMMKSGRQDAMFFHKMWLEIRKYGQWHGEIWNRRKNGEVFPEWLTINSVYDDQQSLTHFVAVYTDISEHKKTEAQLNHLVRHDALTDLPNRAMFDAMLEQAMKHAHRTRTLVAVLLIDLDRFKNINDSLGHHVGDQLLIQLSERFKNVLRADDIVARLGGDEFIILLQDIQDPQQVITAVEKITHVFDQPFELDSHHIRVSASIGISLFPDDAADAASLLSNADAAMYRAKQDGRNTYHFYTETLTANAYEMVLLENALRGALDRQELHLVYQPQIDLKSESIVGFEALLRWQHAELGLVSPAKFIPLAEQSGLIHDIGEWVLNEACRQAQAWLQKGLTFGKIAVNVAGPQLQRGGFVGQVKSALERSAVPAAHLELEVTEGFIMQDAEHAIGQLTALRRLGIEVAIDDFGTGYSSLSYLKKLPIQKLKIDRSFIQDIPNDVNDMAIAEAIIALSKAMSLKVIAEGVETREQATFLRKKGCWYAQGFWYGKPLSVQDAEAFLVKSRR